MIFSFIFHNWRFNPFKEDLSDALNPATITDEEHIIVWDEDAKIYLIRLHEAPQFDNPSSMTIMEDTIEYEEVPRGTGPATEQYRVDYDADTFFGTGIIEFNSVDVGKTVKVSYQGLGTVVKNRYQLDQTTVIPNNVGIEGNLVVSDAVHIRKNISVTADFGLGGGMATDLNLKNFHIYAPKIPIDPQQVGDRDYNDGRYDKKEKDFDFDRPESWLLSDANVVFTNNGTNGKRAITFTANGAIHTTKFIDSNGNLKFFPVMERAGINGIIRAEKDALFDGDLDVNIDFYDKNKNLLRNDIRRFFNSELLTKPSMFTFAFDEPSLNVAYYTLGFGIRTNATAGVVHIDFWRIGNNIGYSSGQVLRMLSTSGRGSYGAPDRAKWSGKGFIKTRPLAGENDYVITLNGNNPSSNIIIDGTEKFQFQVTHVWVKIDNNNNIKFECAVNALPTPYSFILSDPLAVSDDIGIFYLVPVYDYSSNGTAIVRIWRDNPTDRFMVVHAFFVN